MKYRKIICGDSMVDNNKLENLLADTKKYYKASNLYEAGCVNITRVADFWRNDKEVSGEIYDKDKIYRSKITVSRDDIVSFSCNCNEFTKDKAVCHHIGGLYLAYSGRYVNENKLIYTSMEARKIVNGYLKKKQIDNKTSDIEKVSLLLTMKFNKSNIILSYSVGIKEKTYRIKNIFDFVKRINEKEYYEYGKNKGFVHSMDVFDDESRLHVEYICNIIRMEEELCKLADVSKVLIEDNNKIILCAREIDTFFRIFKDKQLMVDEMKHSIVNKNPEIYVKAIGEGNGGFTILMENIKGYLEGADNLYIYDGKNIYITDRDFADKMYIFIKNICDDKDRKLLINHKDMSAFCNGVVPEIMKYAIVDMSDDLLVKYKPWELKNSFIISATKEEVTVRISTKYNDNVFDLYTGVCSDRNVCRDYAKEFELKTIFDEYKAYRLQNGELRISGYDNIYEFLVIGIKRLSEYGEVMYDKAMSDFHLRDTYELSANVSVDENWLYFDLDTGEYTEDELNMIISAYRRKEKYVAINDNTLVKVYDNGFEFLGSLAYDLDFSVKDLINHNIFVPRYRVMYIDAKLSQNEGKYNTDVEFNKLIKNINSIENEVVLVSNNLAGILRDYQYYGYKWLKTMDSCGFGGILADDMGLGKTLQIIALLCNEYLDKDEDKNKDNDKDDNTLCGSRKKSLIIVPASLIYNWENEIVKFASSLKVAAVVGAKSERVNIIENSDADILITSYELLKRDVNEYSKYSFRFQILDEAQNIKNYTTQNARAVKKIQAETRFALTGTPVENRLSELWSIFDFIMPGFFGSNRKFKEKYEIPIVKEQVQEVKESLKHLVSPFILRRLKKDVLKELPEKLEYNVYCKMEGEQNKLYMANAYRLKEELENKDNDYYSANKIKFLAEITRLRQICCDPSLCYEDYEDESAKLNTCIELINTSIEGGHKILVFSQFTSMLQIIAKRLIEEGISFYTLTGKTSVDERLSLVNRFNKDDTQVFLMSLKVGGIGLNLTGADVVIHYDPWWNMAVQNQATDRVHRIGQKNDVTVYKLIAKDSIEENIKKLQKAKEKLCDDIISGNISTISDLSKDELLSILIG